MDGTSKRPEYVIDLQSHQMVIDKSPLGGSP